MKSNFRKRSGLILLVMVFTFVNAGMAVYAGGQLKEIKAYVNEGITIKVDRIQQNMADANGKRVYPISYNGSTYVPIRAVSQMFGKQVKWDGATQTVMIGNSDSAGTIDSIDGIESYERVLNRRYTDVNAGMAVYAGGQLKEIKAYVNEGITIKVNRIQQNMADANGKRVYPISYNGSTYVPIRAVSQMFGKQVKWDGATQTVMIGDSGSAGTIDFIDGLKPYTYDWRGMYYPTTNGETVKLVGKLYNHWIKGQDGGKLYYNLEGKYKKITFQAYSQLRDGIIRFVGDNDTALKTVILKEKELPTTHTVDVTGVQRMVLYMGDSWNYVFNATIE